MRTEEEIKAGDRRALSKKQNKELMDKLMGNHIEETDDIIREWLKGKITTKKAYITIENLWNPDGD